MILDFLCRIELSAKIIYKPFRNITLFDFTLLLAMNHKKLQKSYQVDLVKLFTGVFTRSEGVKEGKALGEIVSKLSAAIDDDQVLCFASFDNSTLVGAIFLSSLQFNEDVKVYMLSPVAVTTQLQGKGVGQSLINHGLEQLRMRGVRTVVTYGDPAFYSKVGFTPLSEAVIQAPHPLSMEHGWLGQSLNGGAVEAIKGRPHCVDPFNDLRYW